MEKTEQTQTPPLAQYSANSSGDQRPVFGCPIQGKQFDCRITLFTSQLGVIFSILTYKDVAIKGSGLLNRLLSQMKATALTSQVCNVDPIAALLGNNTPEYQNGAVAWIFWYLQFIYDHPGDISVVKQLALPSFRLDNAACITRLIDVLVIAHFFEIGPLQDHINRSLVSVCMTFAKQHFFIFTKRPAGPLRFKQFNIPGLLESTTLAIFRAARIVPANSQMWPSVVLIYRTRRQVDDFTDVGEKVSQHILRLCSISAFASAWVRATCELKTVCLDGIFSQSPNWALQTADCACSACSMRVWRRDLVERLPGEVATGAVQKYALVNPFDGFKTVFCDYCFRNCGMPWGNGNKPCDPHE